MSEQRLRDRGFIPEMVCAGFYLNSIFLAAVCVLSSI